MHTSTAMADVAAPVHREEALGEHASSDRHSAAGDDDASVVSLAGRIHGMNDDDSKMVQGLLTQFQSIGMIPPVGPIVIPKLTLFLTNSELDNLNLNLEVNDVLDISFNNGHISIRRSNEGS